MTPIAACCQSKSSMMCLSATNMKQPVAVQPAADEKVLIAFKVDQHKSLTRASEVNPHCQDISISSADAQDRDAYKYCMKQPDKRELTASLRRQALYFSSGWCLSIMCSQVPLPGRSTSRSTRSLKNSRSSSVTYLLKDSGAGASDKVQEASTTKS